MSADLQRIIRIVFKGDNDTIRSFNEINKGFSDLELMVGKVTKPLANVADSVLKADAALFALAAGGIALAVNEAGKFGDGFNEISTLINATGPELDAFRKEFIAYGRDSKFALEDVNSAVYEAISRYTHYTDSLGFVATAERLAIAGKSDLTSATVLLASSMSAYGASADEAQKYSDIFFTIVKEGGTTLPAIADTLAKVTAIAGPVGFGLDQVGAALATLTANGMPTSEAMTAILGVVSAIIKPSTEAAKAAGGLGIEFNASALAAKGLDGFLLDVMQRTGGNVETLGLLFGRVTGLTAVMSAFGRDGGDMFIGKLAEMRESAGATDTAYAKMVDNFSLANKQLKNNLRMTLAEIGTPLLKEYGVLAESLIDIFKGVAIGLGDDAFDPLFSALNSATGDLSKYLSDIAEILPEALAGVDWEPFLSALRSLGAALGEYFSGADLTKVRDLQGALQTVVDVVAGLIRVTAGMADAFRPFVEQITAFFVELSKGDAQAQETAGKIIGLAKAIESAGLAVVGLLLTMEQSGASWGQVFQGVAGAATVAWQTLRSTVLSVMLAFTEAALLMNKLGDALTLGQTDYFGGNVESLELFRDTLIDSRDEADKLAREGMDRLKGSFDSTSISADAAAQGQARFAQAVDGTLVNVEDLRDKMRELGHDVDSMPDDLLIHLFAETDSSWDDAFWKAQELKDEDIAATIKAEVDAASLEDTRTILGTFTDQYGETKIIYGPSVDQASLQETEKTIDQLLKEREIDVQFDIEKIKANSEIVQASIEWQAKLDIANVEQETERIKGVFQTLSESITSTGELLPQLFESGFGDITSSWTDQNFLAAEMNRRKEAFELQKALTEEQIESMRARREAMERGDAMITINGEGLQPHLEAFMWEILAAIQTRVNEEGLDMLMGTETT